MSPEETASIASDEKRARMRWDKEETGELVEIWADLQRRYTGHGTTGKVMRPRAAQVYQELTEHYNEKRKRFRTVKQGETKMRKLIDTYKETKSKNYRG